MKRFLNQTLQQIIIQNFNFCFFIALCLLSLYPQAHHDIINDQNNPILVYLLYPTINGLLTALISLLINAYLSFKNYAHPYYTEDKTKLFFVAFSAGFMSIYIIASSTATLLISALIIYVAVLNVRFFITKISELLQPTKMATLRDIGEFINFFINLIITFSVINLSINTLHSSLQDGQAFNFGQGVRSILDAVYFSVVTMTTVGYGEIVPNSPAARIVVAFECLTSYTLLGIMIGIVNRGIDFKK